MVKKTKYKNLR